MARDDNAFNMRRFANIFSGGPQQDPLMNAYRKVDFNRPQPQQAPPQMTPQAAPQTDPFAQALERMRGGQASNAYREHIGKMPTQEQYAPSQTRRIGGALAAAAGAFNDPRAGAAIGEQIIGAPYRNALESWQMKGAGLKEQADIESQDVKSQIEYIKRIQEQQQQERQERRDIRRLDIDEMRARTDQTYRQAMIDNMATQGWQSMVGADGNRILYKPGEPTQNLGPDIAGRTAANAERGTNIRAGQLGVAQGNLGVAQANLGMRGQEFNYRQGQDAILNQDRALGRDIQQQNTDISRQNAGAAGYVNAGEVFTANALAAQEVSRANSKFNDWTLDDNGRPARPGTLYGTNPVDPNSADAKEYLRLVEEAKGNILRTRRPGVGNVPGRVARPNMGGMGQGPIKFGDLPPGEGGLKF